MLCLHLFWQSFLPKFTYLLHPMKVKSIKSFMFIGVCVWGVTGALAFWAGKTMGSHAATPAVTKAKSTAKNSYNFVSGSTSTKDPGAPLDGDLLSRKGKLSAADVARWAASLDPKEYADEMGKLQALPAGAKRDAMLTALYDTWAKQDPVAFLAAGPKMTNPAARTAALTDALNSWGAKDPKAAMDWLKANPGPTIALNAQEYNSILTGYAATNPTDALAMVTAMGETNPGDLATKRQAMQAVISGMAQNGDFTNIPAMIDGLPTNMQNSAYNQLLQSWGAESPVDAAKWITSLDPQYQTRYGRTLITSWAMSDPLAAAQWAATQDINNPNGLNGGGGAGGGGPGGGRGNNSLLAQTINSWVAAGGVDDAGQYLNSLPASTDKDKAVSSFVSNVMTEDPSGAMNWAKTIADPNTQLQSMDRVAGTWNQIDPQGFQQYLGTLDQSTAAQLLQASQQYAGGFGPGAGFGPGGGGGRRGGRANGVVGGTAAGGVQANNPNAPQNGPTVISAPGTGRGGRRGRGGNGGGGGG